MHAGRGDELLVLLAVGREGHTAVEEHLDVGPHLLQVRLARHLHHTGEHGEHPRGHARDVRHILRHRLTGYPLALHLEVGEQRRLLLRHTHQVHQRVDVLDEDRREVAHQRVPQIIVRRVAAAKYQAPAVEHPRLRIVTQVERHRVEAACIVDILQTLATDGDELRLVVGRTTRLRIPLHAPRPEHIRLSLAHPVDTLLQLLIRVYRHMAYEFIIALDGREGVLSTVFRVLRLLYQPLEHCPLQCLTLALVLIQVTLAGYEYLSY